LYTLLTLHARARGEIVAKREDADKVLAVNGGDLEPFDLDEIRTNYL
jgi:hypothetical protein